MSYSYGQISTLDGFKRLASGGLKDWKFDETDPAPPSGWSNYYPWLLAGDSKNHLAITLYPYQTESDGAMQLASYTVDSAGNLSTTNKSTDMPTPKIFPEIMSISPSGKLLAIAGISHGGCPGVCGSAGLEVFHFNGASPITAYSKPLTTVEIDQVLWDRSNHLYALNEPGGKLFVYTITPTSIVEAPGSPFSVPADSNVLIVVPK